jgi:hypothetical protein
MHNPYQPLGVTSERRHRAPDRTSRIAAVPRQSQSASPEPSWFVRAMSWLGSAVLEGFALYGQSIYPCVIDPPEAYDAQGEDVQRPAFTPLPTRVNPWLPPATSSRDSDIRACLASASSHLPQHTRGWIRLAAVLPGRRTGRSKQLSHERVGVPDDRSLRVNGVDPLDTSTVPRRLDPAR